MEGVEGLIVLMALGFGVAVLFMPIAALVAAHTARRRAFAVQREVDALTQRLALLESRVDGVRPVAWPAPSPGPLPAPVELPPQPVAPPLEPQLPLDSQTPPRPAQSEAPPVVAQPTDVPTGASEPATPVAAPAPRAFDWENLIGVRLFAWLGGAALFLGGALFLNYSIQHDLVAPPLRVAIGIVFGSAALLFGDRVRLKAAFAGQAISGAGIAILYASLFAASSLYHLIGTTPAFLGMAFVTVVAGTIAVRRSALMLAILGLVGGMATPYLLSTGEDRPIALFGYVALLDMGIVVVAQRRRWPVLGLLALAGSAVLYVGWSATFLDAPRVPFALAAAAILAALFAFTRWSPEEPERPAALPRATVYVAAAAPLLLALFVGSSAGLAVAPAFLAAYLVLILGGTWAISRRLDAPALTPIAAAFATVTLAVRVRADLFPSHAALTLVLFSAVPAATVAAWLWRRGTEEAPVLRIAAALALGGSVLTVGDVLGVAGTDAAIVPLAVFAGVHAAALVAIGAMDRQSTYVAVAQAVEFASLLLLLTHFRQERLGEFVPMVALPMVGFWALPLASPRLRQNAIAWLSCAAALIVHFPALYTIAKPEWGSGPLGFIAVCCAAMSLVMLRHARATLATGSAASIQMSALFGGETLLFLTAAVPILLHDEWVTVAWALETAALAWLNRRITHRGLVIAAAGLAAAAFVRLVFNPAVWEYHARTAVPVLNFYLYTFGVPALALFGAARLLAGDKTAARFRLVPALNIAAAVILFVLLNVEIADVYSTGSTLTFQFTGGGLAQDMTYSLAWGTFALATLVLGILRRRTPIRIGALVVLTLTIAKVFLHDLWELGALYRVGSIVGLAVALLAVSFLTQRFVLRAETR